MKRLVMLVFTGMLLVSQAEGQRRIINLPDLPGYVTLKCDFHLHSVFSDGSVWPTLRVDEALRDGLDAIAITDHLEYTPKEAYIPVDHNAAWKLGEPYARERNLILVHGTEITRDMPPGHFNALFIKDASIIDKDSVWDSFEAAAQQGAFLLWNHPGWKSQQPDGIPRMYDIHKKLLSKGWLHGIEFFNGKEHYPLVFTWCKQYKLALIGNSDTHGVISESYQSPSYPNRPMTLVFAKEKSHDSLKEAMFAGRTIVWFGNNLAGKEEFTGPFVNACITVRKPFHQNEKNIFLEIQNSSDIPFYLVNGPKDAPETISLQARSVTRLALSKKVQVPLVYEVKNVMTGENEVLKIELKY